MLYSTCTFDPGENERIIEHLKKEYPEFHVLPMESYEGFCPGIPEVTEEKDEELKKTVRIFPHKMKGEGHYVALLQKGEPLPAKELKTKKKGGKDSGRPGRVYEAGNLETGRFQTGYPW